MWCNESVPGWRELEETAEWSLVSLQVVDSRPPSWPALPPSPSPASTWYVTTRQYYRENEMKQTTCFVMEIKNCHSIFHVRSEAKNKFLLIIAMKDQEISEKESDSLN